MGFATTHVAFMKSTAHSPSLSPLPRDLANRFLQAWFDGPVNSFPGHPESFLTVPGPEIGPQRPKMEKDHFELPDAWVSGGIQRSLEASADSGRSPEAWKGQ